MPNYTNPRRNVSGNMDLTTFLAIRSVDGANRKRKRRRDRKKKYCDVRQIKS